MATLLHAPAVPSPAVAGPPDDWLRITGRSPWVDRLNAMLDTAWARGWSPRPVIDPRYWMDRAERRHGRVDFAGRREWLGRLDVLANALVTEAQLNPLGETMAHGQLARIVDQRVRLETLWRRRPDILDVPVPSPIIVLGHMRSGTTRIQRMLASDRRIAATRFCDSWTPAPPRGPDWRPGQAWTALRMLQWINPRFAAIHPTAPRAVDEEIGWLGLGLSTTPFDAQWHIPSFNAAVEARDSAPVYALLRRVVQTDQWRRGADARARVLKVPQFMEDADALLAAFPSARIIRVTRDPVAVVASSCSLVANQMAVQSDTVQPARIGREWLRKTVRRERIASAALARGGRAIAHVDYDRMDLGWQGVMRDVYRTLGMPLDDSVLKAMAKAWRKPVVAGPAHQYRLEDFGLSPHQVRRALGKG